MLDSQSSIDQHQTQDIKISKIRLKVKNIKKVELISSSHFNIKSFDYKIKISSRFQDLSSNKETKINQIANQEQKNSISSVDARSKSKSSSSQIVDQSNSSFVEKIKRRQFELALERVDMIDLSSQERRRYLNHSCSRN